MLAETRQTSGGCLKDERVIALFLVRTLRETDSLVSHLFFTDFIQGLAVDAQCGRRARFKATDTDFHAAAFAFAVLMVIDTLQGFVDFFNELAFAISGA